MSLSSFVDFEIAKTRNRMHYCHLHQSIYLYNIHAITRHQFLSAIISPDIGDIAVCKANTQMMKAQ